MKPNTVLLVIASNLIEHEGVVALGSESEEACNTAMNEYRKRFVGMIQNETIILVTACSSPDSRYQNITIAQLMFQYMVSHNIKPEHIAMGLAKSFNTMGEMLACVRYLNSNSGITNVVICVKWWHALRSYVLLYLSVHWFCQRSVDITVRTCTSEMTSPRSVLKEFWFAGAWNMIRISGLYFKKVLRINPL